MEKSWVIDTFVVFATQPSFATISKEKIRWGIYDPSGYRTQSKSMMDELLDVLITEEEDELILVGRSNGWGHINAFRVSTTRIRNLESLGRGLSTGSSHYNRTTDCCCLTEKEDKLVMMMANIDPRRREGRLYETFLE